MGANIAIQPLFSPSREQIGFNFLLYVETLNFLQFGNFRIQTDMMSIVRGAGNIKTLGRGALPILDAKYLAVFPEYLKIGDLHSKYNNTEVLPSSIGRQSLFKSTEILRYEILINLPFP